jgi:hypothetical protein
MILAIDPGTTESAYVMTEGRAVREKGTVENSKLLECIQVWSRRRDLMALEGFEWPEKMYVEMIASYGMPVGREVFETCVWIGRFIEAWQGTYSFVYRKDVKLSLCGTTQAKDGNIRQALIDLYGGKEKSIGKKSSPGPLYGVSGDVWAALAVAVYVDETTKQRSMFSG